MTTVKILEVTEPVHCKYHGQCESQDAYIELDCRSGVLTASYDAEIGGGIPFSVYNGHDQRWHIRNTATEDSINGILEKIEGQAQIVLDGYTERFDGNNMVASFNEAAEDAIESIGEIIEDYPIEDYLVINDWGNWFTEYPWSYFCDWMDFSSIEEWVADVVDDVRLSNGILASSETPAEWLIKTIKHEFDWSITETDFRRLVSRMPKWMIQNDEIAAAIKSEEEYWA